MTLHLDFRVEPYRPRLTRWHVARGVIGAALFVGTVTGLWLATPAI